jgi:hypothetical protein
MSSPPPMLNVPAGHFRQAKMLRSASKPRYSPSLHSSSQLGAFTSWIYDPREEELNLQVFNESYLIENSTLFEHLFSMTEYIDDSMKLEKQRGLISLEIDDNPMRKKHRTNIEHRCMAGSNKKECSGCSAKMGSKPHSLSRQGLFAFSFSFFALFSTLLACGAVIFDDAFSAVGVTFIVTIATGLWINSGFKTAISEYYQQHQSLIEEAEALNAQNATPGIKPEPQHQVIDQVLIQIAPVHVSFHR